MIDTVIVQICESKEIVYLNSNNLEIKKNDLVVFDYNGSSCMGVVLDSNSKQNKKNLDLPLNKILRIALDLDIDNSEAAI